MMRIRCTLAGLGIVALLSVATLGAQGLSPLADAVQRRDAQAVQALLKKRADVNAPQSDGATALHWAAYLNDAETATLLLRAGAKVNVRNNLGVTPLALAAQQGSAVLVEKLIKAGAAPNDPVNFVHADESPLMHAARSGSVEAVKALACWASQARPDPDSLAADTDLAMLHGHPAFEALVARLKEGPILPAHP